MTKTFYFRGLKVNEGTKYTSREHSPGAVHGQCSLTLKVYFIAG